MGAYVASQTGRRQMTTAGEFVVESDAEVAARHGLDLEGLTKQGMLRQASCTHQRQESEP